MSKEEWDDMKYFDSLFMILYEKKTREKMKENMKSKNKDLTNDFSSRKFPHLNSDSMTRNIIRG